MFPTTAITFHPPEAMGMTQIIRTRAATSMRSGQLGWPSGACPEQYICVGPDRSIPGSERCRRADRQISGCGSGLPKNGDSKEAAPEGAVGECVERFRTRSRRRCSCCRHRRQIGSGLSRRLRPCCKPRFRRTPLRCRSFLHRLGTDGARGGWNGEPCGYCC